MNIYNPQQCYFIVLTINFIRGKKVAVPRNWGTALFIEALERLDNLDLIT